MDPIPGSAVPRGNHAACVHTVESRGVQPCVGGAGLDLPAGVCLHAAGETVEGGEGGLGRGSGVRGQLTRYNIVQG